MESPFRPAVPDGLLLIETFARRDGGFVRLDRHLARLERTARALAFGFDRAAIKAKLATVADDPARVRLTLDREGAATVSAGPLGPSPATWRVAIHPERLDPGDPWLRVKTTARARYDRARAELPEGIDEWLFLNTRGELCEGAITNLFLRRDGALLTPPVAAGLLPGVLREALLAEGAREAVLRPEDLARGELLVGNSLRGLAPARLAG
ncbi:aminotransferase class IV [Amaricoccus sp.]|uniref:aminotransferase class IV n=1 Tax=Amaricoccus sp. TaxID=1872485 RepID=UPI001B6A1460|nr:aminotransferase class IV [Amaricoccus sp.]MBP7240743.1 aminotransferase class IV [Amaricoccus sp.]